MSLRERPELKDLKTLEQIEAQIEDVQDEAHEKLHEAMDLHFDCMDLEEQTDQLEADLPGIEIKDHPRYAEYDKLMEAHFETLMELAWLARDQAHLHMVELDLLELHDTFQERKGLKIVKNKDMN